MNFTFSKANARSLRTALIMTIFATPLFLLTACHPYRVHRGSWGYDRSHHVERYEHCDDHSRGYGNHRDRRRGHRHHNHRRHH